MEASVSKAEPQLSFGLDCLYHLAHSVWNGIKQAKVALL